MITKYKPRRFLIFIFHECSFLGVIEVAENEPNPRVIYPTQHLQNHISRDFHPRLFASLKTATEKLDKMEREHHVNSLKEQGISYHRNELKTFCQTYSTIPGRKVVIIDDPTL
jgi:hypothetical protein